MQLIKRSKIRAPGRGRSNGFTLLEVMVAVVISAIGLLGIAKIQALAYASTSTASLRSLVAIQASGLAASMHANREYWSLGLAPASITITGGVGTSFTISDSYLATTGAASNFCYSGVTSPPCTPSQMASFDLNTWARSLSGVGMLANLYPVTTISCPTTNTPITCTITVTWNERAVAVNTQGANNTVVANGASATAAGTFAPTYILYVEP